jgi:hypothetical protein
VLIDLMSVDIQFLLKSAPPFTSLILVLGTS